MGKYIGIAAMILLGVIGYYGQQKYNHFVVEDEGITGQWAQVENEYKRRLDMIDQLVATVKGYADFESSTLIQVTEARASAFKAMQGTDGGKNLGDFNKANSSLGVAMRGMMGYSEKYPDLKANKNFMHLQTQIEGTENRITTERMRFNEEVEAFNKLVKTFPNSMIASITGFSPRDYFEAGEEAKNAPKIDFSK